MGMGLNYSLAYYAQGPRPAPQHQIQGVRWLKNESTQEVEAEWEEFKFILCYIIKVSLEYMRPCLKTSMNNI